MRGAASYILSITAAAILVAILRSFTGHGTVSRLLRLLGGIFVALAVIAPVLDIRLPDLQEWFAQYASEGQAAASEGAAMGEAAQIGIITQQLEAYIMDKAAAVGASVTVEVQLDPDRIPQAVRITGDAPPQTRKALTKIIEESLGIGEEAVCWIGKS